MNMPLDRRSFLAGVSCVSLVPRLASAEDYIDLEWSDLVPKGSDTIPPSMLGFFNHEELPVSREQPQSSGIRTDWNGKIVRLPGFILPIDYSGTTVSAFILVPFVGACVHVPPPPANQLVFVTAPEPYESSGLYEPVNVIGMFGAASMSTQLADIGYALSADRIEPFGS